MKLAHIMAIVAAMVFSNIALADCAHTVMGGGCGVDMQSGTSPHMRGDAAAEKLEKEQNSSKKVSGAEQKPAKPATSVEQKKI